MENSYYKTKSDKVKDFLMGFWLNILMGVVFFTLNILSLSFILEKHLWPAVPGIINPLLLLLIEMFLFRRVSKKQKYMKIGLISALVLPLSITVYFSLGFLGIL